ncbi:MAG: glycosyltransferase family 2 protein [Bacteroidota bacterium]
MKRKNKSNLWEFRESIASSTFKKMGLAILIVAGGISILRLFDWWFKEEHVASITLFIILSCIFWWGILRTIILWISYLGISKPAKRPPDSDLSVAIFTTSSPGEPLSMFVKTLEACSRITYPHTTYLLDDTQDGRFRAIAEKYGAVWLELVGLQGAKAGKINAALAQTSEDFILVLDPDHIPFPNFFDEVLGYFADEQVGYVQVSQAYYNQYKSFTAKAAAEQTYGFYGPTQMAMQGHNCAVAIGANCTFRRTALESIGGHGVGLAEDLVTAIRIHAKKWKSIYSPIIVSRGLVPEDFGSFCKQQLKWARGVHEVLFAELPEHWKNLTFWQRLSYLTIGTYYFSGITMFLFLLIPFLYFLFGWQPANMDFSEFLINWLPVGLLSLLIYLYVQIWVCDRENERGLHWRGMILKFACWPIFFRGFILSLKNADLPYIPTEKKAVPIFSVFARPLIFHVFLFIITLTYVLVSRLFFTPEARLSLSSPDIWGMVAFAIVPFLLSFGGIYAAWQSRKIINEDPWSKIDLDKIVGSSINKNT